MLFQFFNIYKYAILFELYLRTILFLAVLMEVFELEYDFPT